MKPDEIRHLLGGYASGTLSEAEQKLLFEAALEDQVLFDAMADEQALKDLLDDPESRGYLQAVLDEPRLEQPRHELFVAKSIMSAPAPAQAPVAPAPPAVRGPDGEFTLRGRPMWWGLLAAASLALISVVGILRLDRTSPPAQMAKNEQKPPKSAAVPSPVDKAVTPPPPEPARAVTIKVPKPLADSKTADKQGPVKEAEKAVEKDAKSAVAGKTVEVVTELRKLQDERKPEVVARREEAAAAPPAVAAPPPPSVPQQAAAPATSNAGPPPAPQQQNAMGNAREPGFRISQQPRAQDQVKAEAVALSARQLYFAGPSTPQLDALASSKPPSLEANKEQTESRDRAGLKRKSAPGAAGGGGSAKGALTQGRSAVASPVPKPGFAMRYQLLRRAGATFAPVAPGTRFRIGEEVVVVIEKNSGGFAVVNRIAEDGSTIPVPMSIQTNEQARSAPLTVTGPIELVVVLSRTNAPRVVSGQRGTQQTEIADGMVYIAEPTVSAGQALVARVSIRVE